MNGNGATGKPWWKNWKVWAGVFAVAAVGSAIEGGGGGGDTAGPTPSPTVEATAEATAPAGVSGADVEAAKIMCMRPEQPASGAMVEPVTRELGLEGLEWMQEPTDEGRTAVDVAKSVVNPDWAKADGGKWLNEWLTARRLDGSEPALHARVKGTYAESGAATWYDCWFFVTRDGAGEGWTSVAG